MQLRAPACQSHLVEYASNVESGTCIGLCNRKGTASLRLYDRITGDLDQYVSTTRLAVRGLQRMRKAVACMRFPFQQRSAGTGTSLTNPLAVGKLRHMMEGSELNSHR